MGRFISINLGTIISIYDYQNYISKAICISVTQQNDTISKFTEYILIRNNIIVMFLDGHFE